MSETVDLIGQSPVVSELREEIDSAARCDAKVLLTGESGVGKEVVARLIHARSSRSRVPLVAVNCAGLPENLLESELFGHVRGSFTGAYRDKVGLLELAHRGTVFLDEVGEMTPRMQGLLLRFLETGEIQRVGGGRAEQRLDVRVVAATNRDLLDSTTTGQFREDLYYRLNVIHLKIPPLRDRREDIPLLIGHCQSRFCDKYRIPVVPFTSEALALMSSYPWRGNVRELNNIVERLVVRSRGDMITVDDLPVELRQPRASTPTDPAAPERSIVDVCFDRMVKEKQSFWSVVYAPFMARDLTRDHLRAIIARGLDATSGSYRILTQLFNIEADDYKRFLSLLKKHQCHMPFQQFRVPPVKIEGLQKASALPTKGAKLLRRLPIS